MSIILQLYVNLNVKMEEPVLILMNAFALLDGVETHVQNVCWNTHGHGCMIIYALSMDIIAVCACTNGGTCVSPGNCACTAEWEGPRCTQGN